jgi:hypothetical protein
MVRQVPKVTIDMGDGRVIRRTLTGNTVIYVLSAEGRVADAFPGVYTPADFLEQVEHSVQAANMPTAQWKAWHTKQVGEAAQFEFTFATRSKAAIETPLLNALGMPRGENTQPAETPANAFEKLSKRILDASHSPMTADELRARFRWPKEKEVSEKELAAYIVGEDSRINVRFVRPAVHLYLSSLATPPTPAEAKGALFKKLLKIDIDDPNLGLTPLLLPGSGG